MENVAFHSLLKWNMITLPILTTSRIHFSLKGWEIVHFELGSESVKSQLHTVLHERDSVERKSTTCHSNFNNVTKYLLLFIITVITQQSQQTSQEERGISPTDTATGSCGRSTWVPVGIIVSNALNSLRNYWQKTIVILLTHLDLGSMNCGHKQKSLVTASQLYFKTGAWLDGWTFSKAKCHKATTPTWHVWSRWKSLNLPRTPSAKQTRVTVSMETRGRPLSTCT